MCFMAFDDEVKSIELNDESSDDEFDDDFDDLSYEELLNDFTNLHRNYEKLILKNSALKKKISSLSKELKDFSKENEVVSTYDTCDSLKNENAFLNEKSFRFDQSSPQIYKWKENFWLNAWWTKVCF